MKRNVPSFFRTLGAEIAGSFLAAVGLYNFALYSNFPLTGFSGIAVIIYRLTGLPIGWLTVFMNIPVALLCWKGLGRDFLCRSLRCMLISSLMIDYLAPLLPVYRGDMILSCVCTGALQGLGYGLIYSRGSSSGGIDFVTSAITNKWPHISLGIVSLINDVVIILAGAIVFANYEGIIYGVIIAVINSYMLNKMMFGANAGKLLLIVTEKGVDISRLIDKVIDRGCTIIPAQGGYRQDDKQVVMCACSSKQIYALQEELKKDDPSSFMVILDSSEVHGQGFKYHAVGKN